MHQDYNVKEMLHAYLYEERNIGHNNGAGIPLSDIFYLPPPQIKNGRVNDAVKPGKLLLVCKDDLAELCPVDCSVLI